MLFLLSVTVVPIKLVGVAYFLGVASCVIFQMAGALIPWLPYIVECMTLPPSGVVVNLPLMGV